MKLTGKLGSQANSRSAVDLRVPAGMVRVITLNPPPGPFIWHKVSYFVFSAVLHSQAGFFFFFSYFCPPPHRTCWAVWNPPGPVSRGKIEAAGRGRLRATEDIITSGVSPKVEPPPKRSSIKVDPRPSVSRGRSPVNLSPRC